MTEENKIEINQIKDYLFEVLDISLDDISSIQLLGGMTNKNYRVVVKGKEYVLRTPGSGTERMINRKEEKMNVIQVSELGLDAELIYFNDETGVKITEFIKEAETLNGNSTKKTDYMEPIAAAIRTLHDSNIKMINHFDVFEKIHEYERLIMDLQCRPYDGYDEVKAKVMALKEVYQSLNIILTPCHNDLVPENIIRGRGGKIYLIDWEYSGMNDPIWDVAALSLECEFTQEEEALFLSFYLNQDHIPLDIQQRVLINKIFQDFLWSIWAIFKGAEGDDFGSYGIDRFNRAKENLESELIKEVTYEYKK